MTPESQRIAIAEACGWKNVRNVPPNKWGDTTCIGTPPVVGSPGVPDYLNDLNAMHEAEKVLTEDQRQDFIVKLLEAFLPNRMLELHEIGWVCAHATAAQRAEQFLRTLNLWVEEPVSEATVEGLR